jgi:hypothetical protein
MVVQSERRIPRDVFKKLQASFAAATRALK